MKMTRSINQLLHRAEYTTIFWYVKLWYSTIFINNFYERLPSAFQRIRHPIVMANHGLYNLVEKLVQPMSE